MTGGEIFLLKKDAGLPIQAKRLLQKGTLSYGAEKN